MDGTKLFWTIAALVFGAFSLILLVAGICHELPRGTASTCFQ